MRAANTLIGMGDKYLTRNDMQKPFKCEEAKHWLANIIEDKAEFDRILQNAFESGDFGDVQHYQNMVEGQIGVLRDGLVPPKEYMMARAQEIFGSDYVGPEDITMRLNVILKNEEVPAIPFSEKELERAKELGQFLILRINKARDETPLTMQKIQKETEWNYELNAERLLAEQDWYNDEPLFKEVTPRMGWALVGKTFVSDSTSKNYFGQTKALLSYLDGTVYKEIDEMPTEVLNAIDDYAKTANEELAAMDRDPRKAARFLIGSTINQLFRQTPVEALYDMVMYYDVGGHQPLLQDKSISTAGLTTDGRIVRMGRQASFGVFVDNDSPSISLDGLGVVYSFRG